MKKMLMVLVVVVMSLSFTARASIVDELKQWDFSLGGACYLVEQDMLFYSVGTHRDLGTMFNWIDEEKFYFDIGYLMNGDARAYGYVGVSVNSNIILNKTLSGINSVLNANFQTPEILDEILAHVGIIGAKRMETLFDVKQGYDYGANLRIIHNF